LENRDMFTLSAILMSRIFFKYDGEICNIERADMLKKI